MGLIYFDHIFSDSFLFVFVYSKTESKWDSYILAKLFFAFFVSKTCNGLNVEQEQQYCSENL